MSNPFAQLATSAGHVLGHWPITAKINPFKGFLGGLSKENMVFLMASAMLPRTIVGGVRIAADYPALNPKPIPERDKTRTFLERIFVEAIGTVSHFVVMMMGQDVVANAFESFDKSFHPKAVMAKLKTEGKLSTAELQQVEQAFLKTFQAESIDQIDSLVMRQLFNKGNSGTFLQKLPASFAQHIEQPLQHLLNDGKLTQLVNPNQLEKQALKPAMDFFATLNRRSNIAQIGGAIASITYAGIWWQNLNDKGFREHAIPWILDTLGLEKETEESTTPLKSPYQTPEGVPSAGGLYSPAVHPLGQTSFRSTPSSTVSPHAPLSASTPPSQAVATTVPPFPRGTQSQSPQSYTTQQYLPLPYNGGPIG